MLKRRDTILAITEQNIVDVKAWQAARVTHLKRVNLAFDFIEPNIAGEDKEGRTLVKWEGCVWSIDHYNFSFDDVTLKLGTGSINNNNRKLATKHF